VMPTLTAIQNQRAKVTPLMMSTAITNRAIHPPIPRIGLGKPKEQPCQDEGVRRTARERSSLHDGATSVSERADLVDREAEGREEPGDGCHGQKIPVRGPSVRRRRGTVSAKTIAMSTSCATSSQATGRRKRQRGRRPRSRKTSPPRRSSPGHATRRGDLALSELGGADGEGDDKERHQEVDDGYPSSLSAPTSLGIPPETEYR
jgi:hypothetical protein